MRPLLHNVALAAWRLSRHGAHADWLACALCTSCASFRCRFQLASDDGICHKLVLQWTALMHTNACV